MKQLIVVPEGWPLHFKECPPGLFLFHEILVLKSEYGDDAYLADSGEMFWGGASSTEERANLVVQPCDTNG